MALLSPGITQNLRFSTESTFTKEGSLKIVMESKFSDTELMAAMANDETIEPSKSGFIVYPPNLLDFDKNAKSGTALLGELNAIKLRLLDYAALLGPLETAKEAFGGVKMFEGLGVEPEKYAALVEALVKKETLEKVLSNLGRKFLAYMSAQPNFTEVAFRHKFYRQSKTKHYATIPWAIKGVIVESMEVPQEATKLSWSEWEIEKGKNNPNPVAADKPKAKKAGSLFEEEVVAPETPGTGDLF